MRTAQSFLYSSVLLLLLSAAAAAKELCNPQDKKALLEYKKNRNIPNYITYWNASIDCCKHWVGVTCDPNTHRVNSLFDYDQSFPPTSLSVIGNLPYLTSLDIRKHPNLTGPIPRSLSKLRSLQFLRLDWNSLTGPVPDFLHTLRNLSYINLSFNKFSGSIPASLGLTPTLGYLRLDRNQLTGPIPDSFGYINGGSIYTLDLTHNHLSGPIPASLGNMNFTFLYLARNNLTGDASFLFGKSKPLNQLDLSRNSLSFDMSKAGEDIPSGLQYLILDHNKIYGSLPESMVEVQFMFGLNVSYNRLCGKIPTGGRFGTYDKSSFIHNRCLCGSPLPACS